VGASERRSRGMSPCGGMNGSQPGAARHCRSQTSQRSAAQPTTFGIHTFLGHSASTTIGASALLACAPSKGDDFSLGL
jgi:hypothetical protein